ncbi:MAG: hypothetical protein J6I32_07355 [Bacteroidaceae bacterium]|nr:hypothetical protein [Bacteroidaceae bacterium]
MWLEFKLASRFLKTIGATERTVGPTVSTLGRVVFHAAWQAEADCGARRHTFSTNKGRKNCLKNGRRDEKILHEVKKNLRFRLEVGKKEYLCLVLAAGTGCGT